MEKRTPITVQTIVNAHIEKVWEYWNTPDHITKWAFASDDWECPQAKNDLREGGKFSITMAAKDPSASSGQVESFDFMGIYTSVKKHELIEYDMDRAPGEEKSRHVKVTFEQIPEGVTVTEAFDPENENPDDMQRAGWQAILDNFKKHVEGN